MYTGLKRGGLHGPEAIVIMYKGWINQQAETNNVPRELLGAILLTELRAYNAGDSVFDNLGDVNHHSIGIAQLEPDDVFSHGYHGDDTTVEQIRDKLRKPKEAIALLAKEINYWASKASDLQRNGGLAAQWANGSESKREDIVKGMAGAKDKDKWNPTNDEFGGQGVDAYRILKEKKLLDP